MFLWLQNHSTGDLLKLRTQKCVCYFYSIIFTDADLQAISGLIEVKVHPDIETTNVVAKQPYGQICLAANHVSPILIKDSCPKEDERQRDIIIINQRVDLTKSCIITANMCKNNPCPTSTSGITSKLIIEVTDGPIEVVIPINEDLIKEDTYESINRKKLNPVFNVDSYMNLFTLNNTLVENEGLDYTYTFEVAGPSYAQIWAYNTRRSYLEARVWTLSAVSMSLLTPVIRRSLVTVVSSQCPSLLSSN